MEGRKKQKKLEGGGEGIERKKRKMRSWNEKRKSMKS